MKNYIFILFWALLTIAGAAAANNLSDVVKNRADSIISDAKSGIFPLHLGRKSIVLEMQKYPGQLGSDLGRYTEISIGGSPIPKSMIEGKTPDNIFLLIEGNLEKYLKERSLSIKNAGVKGRIGNFWTTEAIFTLAQNFSAPPAAQVYKDLPELTEWASMANTARLYASFNILPRGILEIAIKSVKKMHNLIDNKQPTRELITETKIHFDLMNNEVTFNYSYQFGNKTKSWTKQSFYVE